MAGFGICDVEPSGVVVDKKLKYPWFHIVLFRW
jgi:hypothetical protein